MLVGIKFNLDKPINCEVRTLEGLRYHDVLTFLKNNNNRYFKTRLRLCYAIGASSKNFDCSWKKVIGALIKLAEEDGYIKLLNTAEVKKENLRLYVE
ncbi:hypothetical protein D3C81_07090 [compost metagenome]